MNCTDTARLLNAHVDGELDLATTLSIQEHLDACAACRRSHATLQAVRAAIARHAGDPGVPPELRASLAPGGRPAARGRLAALLRSPLAIAAPGLIALVLAAWLALAPPERTPGSPPALRIVYHISSSDNAAAALRNLSNHLRAAPHAKLVVVAHNEGVDFLLAGALDPAGRPFEEVVREFRRRGVEFRLCHNTLERRGIAGAKVIPEVVIVPSGIAEIGRLQIEEGYAYMRL